jgi:pimeloyl-ACP methyl ester carboxylesterase
MSMFRSLDAKARLVSWHQRFAKESVLLRSRPGSAKRTHCFVAVRISSADLPPSAYVEWLSDVFDALKVGKTSIFGASWGEAEPLKCRRAKV